jgi:uncharacterized protein YcbX
MASVRSIYHYPVKGLTAAPLPRASLARGGTLPLDRAYAVAHGSTDFDPDRPVHLGKRKFLQLMENERLASLDARLDADGATLVIARDGRPVAQGRLDQPVGRRLLEQFLAAYLGAEVRGSPRIVSAPGHHFADDPRPMLSLINLASVADLARVAGGRLDPLRFRGNLYLAGLPAWAELSWLDRPVQIGRQARLRVVDRIARCAATNVDPRTGARDRNLPRSLRDAFGHVDMGVYAVVETGGEIAVDDPVTVAD